jgi:hypothetical protein
MCSSLHGHFVPMLTVKSSVQVHFRCHVHARSSQAGGGAAGCGHVKNGGYKVDIRMII